MFEFGFAVKQSKSAGCSWLVGWLGWPLLAVDLELEAKTMRSHETHFHVQIVETAGVLMRAWVWLGSYRDQSLKE